jgi:hypothetical protein
MKSVKSRCKQKKRQKMREESKAAKTKPKQQKKKVDISHKLAQLHLLNTV